MGSSRTTRTSKLLALVLRHEPARIGLALDAEGFARVDELLACLAAHGAPLTRDELAAIVRDNNKQRYAFSEDGARIRASQGHSIAVDLGLSAITPPARLFHGTDASVVASIRERGLLPGERTHVHLSADDATAKIVAARRKGPHVILVVRALDLHEAGHAFYKSENGVWLTNDVPAAFIDFPA